MRCTRAGARRGRDRPGLRAGIARYLGARRDRHVLATNTGTLGVHLGLLGCRRGTGRRGDHALAFNFVADHQAIAATGARCRL